MVDSSPQSQPQILVLGASYGGLSTTINILNLLKGNQQLPSPISVPKESFQVPETLKPEITILDERDGFFHTMGAPLAHTSAIFAPEAWRSFSSIKLLAASSTTILQGSVTKLDMNSQIVSYTPATASSNSMEQDRELGYDYLVVATGMRRAFPIVRKALVGRSYLEDTRRHIAGLEGAEKVLIVGGGAVGIEIAGEVASHFLHKKVVLVHSRSQLLNAEPLPEEFKTKSLELLQDIGVEVNLGKRVVSEETGGEELGGDRINATLSDGEMICCGKIIYTTSKHEPNTGFLPPEVVAENVFVRVRDTLQFALDHENSDSHFALGDIAFWPGIKRVGNAFIMGQFVATNIVSLMIRDVNRAMSKEISELVKCPRFDPMMALTIGKNVVGYRPGAVLQSGGEELKEAVVGRGLGIDVC